LTPRLQRIRMQLLRYKYKIRHTPGKDLITADIFSRKPVAAPSKSDQKFEDELNTHVINVVRSIPASSRMLSCIRTAQQSDTGQKLREYILHGWPKNKNEIPETLIAYWQYQSSLCYEQGLILFGKRLWIPSSLRRELLARLHESHFGISKSIARAQSSIWWPKINANIEEMVKDC